MNRSSFTSADALPTKLMRNVDLISHIRQGVIPPIHAQMILTNRCNLKCSFCSCANDDRATEMSLSDAIRVISILRNNGTKAVTITGGGEPTLHPAIEEIFHLFSLSGIEIGLVTNGTTFLKDSSYLRFVKWCRISSADERGFTDKYAETLSHRVKQYPNVDWAFSHVVSATPNYEAMSKMISFANAHDFTHVRLVADLFSPETSPHPATIKNHLNTLLTDDSRVIYQPRTDPPKGGKCYMGYIKPLIGADMRIYACCGVQYALAQPSKDLPEELCLGHILDFPAILNNVKPLDGSKCVRCYYTSYNKVIDALLVPVVHEAFI